MNNTVQPDRRYKHSTTYELRQALLEIRHIADQFIDKSGQLTTEQENRGFIAMMFIQAAANDVLTEPI